MKSTDYKPFCIKPHLGQCEIKNCFLPCKHLKLMTQKQIEKNAMDIAQIFAKDNKDEDYQRIIDIAMAAQRFVLNQIGVSIWNLKSIENNETK